MITEAAVCHVLRVPCLNCYCCSLPAYSLTYILPSVYASTATAVVTFPWIVLCTSTSAWPLRPAA